MKNVLKLFVINLFLLFTSNSFAYKGKSFVENVGQIKDQTYLSNSEVLFLLGKKDFNVQLRKSGFSYDAFVFDSKSDKQEDENQKSTIKFHRIDFDFIGYNSSYTVVKENPVRHDLRYYIGKDAFHTKGYTKVVYKNLYNKIDLEFLVSEAGDFKYNFILHSGADINSIQLKINGASTLKMLDGKLFLETVFGEIEESIPYSELIDSKKEIKVKANLANSLLTFSTSDNIIGQEVLIDPYPHPTVGWGTFVGGEGDEGNVFNPGTMETDSHKDTYVGGHTNSIGNIATAGAFQSLIQVSANGFVEKFDAHGVLIWGTYFGTQVPYVSSQNSKIRVTTMSAKGSALFIAGLVGNAVQLYTTNGVFQETAGNSPTGGWNQDGFLAKLSFAGEVQWSSYYGGSGGDEISKIINPVGDRVFIGGTTSSISGMTTSGAFLESYAGGNGDIMLAEFNGQTGQRVWGTYYGGSGWDRFAMLDYSSFNQRLVLVFNANSADGISTPGAFRENYFATTPITGDIAVVSLSLDGATRFWGSYYGINGAEEYSNIRDIAVAANGDIYFGSLLRGNGSPVTFAGNSGPNSIGTLGTAGAWYPTFADAFAYNPPGSYGNEFAYIPMMTRFSADGQRLATTLLPIAPHDIDLDHEGNVMITGASWGYYSAPYVPISPNPPTAQIDGTYLYIVKPDLSGFIFGTYLGTGASCVPLQIQALDLNNFITCVKSDYTTGNGGLVTPGAHKTVMENVDFVLTLFCNSQVSKTNADTVKICDGTTVDLDAIEGWDVYTWSGQGNHVGKTFTVSEAGTYYLEGEDYAGCLSKDTVVVEVITTPEATITYDGSPFCSSDTDPSADIVGFNGGVFSSTAGLDIDATSGQLDLSASTAGTYTVTYTIEGTENCPDKVSTADITITQAPEATVAYNESPFCKEDLPASISLTGSQGGVYSTTAGLSLNSSTGEITPSTSSEGNYTVTYTVPASGGCPAYTTTTDVEIVASPSLQVNATPQVVTEGGSSQVTTVTNGSTFNWSPSDGLSCTNCQNPVATPTETTEYTVEVTSVEGCKSKITLVITVDPSCPELFIPNLFSPNGDSKNEALSVYGTACMKDGTFRLYDRWGEIVYETTDLSKSWDGIYKGKLISSGVYHYTFEAVDKKGEVITRNGQITVVR